MRTKTYVDYGVENGLMVMIASYEPVWVGNGWKFTVSYRDHKTRKITLTEKLKNFLIKKLGGRLNEKYTREYLWDIHKHEPHAVMPDLFGDDFNFGEVIK